MIVVILFSSYFLFSKIIKSQKRPFMCTCLCVTVCLFTHVYVLEAILFLKQLTIHNQMKSLRESGSEECVLSWLTGRPSEVSPWVHLMNSSPLSIWSKVGKCQVHWELFQKLSSVLSILLDISETVQYLFLCLLAKM